MKLTKFQFIFFGIFFVFIVIGIIAFATYKGSSTSTRLPAITIWGTFPQATFDQYVGKINQSLSQPMTVTYVEKKPDSFSREFISALARGLGPDAILIPADNLYPHLDKVVAIPYNALDIRTFRDSYIDAGEIYLRSDGIVGIPFTLDPLVMYWNRDTFASAGLATYPRVWDEFGDIIKKLTTKDANGNIRKTAISLGDFSNVSNAREIMGALLFEIGNPITVFGKNTNTIETTVKYSLEKSSPESIANFFVQFVNPNSAYYSWNKGMMNDKSTFLAGNLATYFGFASELRDIASKNPNLNFDVAPFPQIKNSPTKATYGKLYGFSILKSSPNQNTVYQVLAILTSPIYMKDLINTLYLPSVRRDVIAQGTSDAYISIFNTSALVAHTWFDSSPSDSRKIFGDMIRDITSGAKTSTEAIRDAEDAYNILLQNATQ